MNSQDAPEAPEPLHLSDIKRGMHIEVRDKNGMRVCHGLVDRVTTDDNEPMVLMYDESCCGDATRFAADMGLKPYNSGRWSDNQRTYRFTGHRYRHSEFRHPDQAIPHETVNA